MRTTLPDDLPRGEMPHEPAEREDVTLGMTALLGIFLAVVLVCAVFFGFGYSTGRTLHAMKSAQASAAAAQTPAGATPQGAEMSEAEASTPATAPFAASPQLLKPSPAAAVAQVPAKTTARGADPVDSAIAQPAENPHERPAAGLRMPAAASVAPAEVAGSGGFMVQIAAVVRQGDADALARALRRNGYSAVMRTEPQDSFLHVQVGPFATRDEARAMRSRLQADGYNAFMKP